jgi:hypothetical protein
MHDLADQRQNDVEALVVSDLDVHHCGRPSLGLVADPDDPSVADVPHDGAGVPQSGDPQGDVLDGADGLACVDDVARAVLVLKDHEDAGQDVLDQTGLRVGLVLDMASDDLPVGSPRVATSTSWSTA